MEKIGNAEKLKKGKDLIGNIWDALVILLIVVLVFSFAIQAGATELDTDSKKVVKTNDAYTSTVTSSGQIQYVKENKTENGEIEKEIVTQEEIAEELRSVLKKYIEGTDEEVDEKIIYLMGAEAVTKMPYVSEEEKEIAQKDMTEEELAIPSTSLEGRIRFFRYEEGAQSTEGNIVDLELKEENRLKYVNEKTFNEMIETYENGGDENGELFKYFTLKDGSAVIAFGTREERKVTTGGETGLADPSITLDVVNNKSSETYGVNSGDGGYISVKYTAQTKTIDYQSLVEQYVMPSNLLYSFLIETRDIAFTEALANLAYESEIAIGIYDNNSESILDENYLYKKTIETNVLTGIDLENIKTSEPEMPVVTSDSIEQMAKEKGVKIPVQHMAIVNEERKLTHGVTQYYGIGPGDGTWETKDQGFYVESLTTANQATGLVSSENAGIFSVNYKQKINAKSTPTVGVVYADTWIAKWTATYLKEEQPVIETNKSGTENDFNEKKYVMESDNAILNEFTSTYKKQMEEALNTKYEEMKRIAKELIVANTDCSIEYDANDVWNEGSPNYIRNNLKRWVNSCSTCKEKVSDWYEIYVDGVLDPNQQKMPNGGEWDVAFKKIKNRNISHVRNHISNSKLSSYITGVKEQRKIERKAKLENELDKQITLNYQKIYGDKNYVEINYTSFFKRTSSIHKKHEEIEMEDKGKRFSKVFNDPAYELAKEGIMTRTDWLWEYMRKTEDTAKLENAVRYLLNLATKSEKFGVFTSEQINNILTAFEPQDMLKISGIYGNTVEAKVWMALINEGYSEYAAAGVMGNLHAESGFKTNNLENAFNQKLGYTDEEYTEAINNGTYTLGDFISDHTAKNCGAGYGLAQWTYYTRKRGLYQFAKHKGVSIDDPDMQIEYLMGELNSSGGADGYASCALSKYKGYTISDWMDAQSPEEAAVAFCWIFEKPGSPHLNTRMEKAREYYERFVNFTDGGVFVKDSDSGMIAGTFTSGVTGRTFTIFNQGKIPGWGDRCNRASQISVCSGYWDGDPTELINMISSNGPRDDTVYNACNLKRKTQTRGLSSPYTFDSTKIRDQLQSGGYVILYVRGYYHNATGVSKYGRDWANYAHWVAILAHRQIDGVDEIFVSDSANRHTGWVPLDEFDGITSSVEFIYEK